MTVFEIKEHALDALSQIEQERLASEPDAATKMSPFDLGLKNMENPMEMTGPLP